MAVEPNIQLTDTNNNTTPAYLGSVKSKPILLRWSRNNTISASVFRPSSLSTVSLQISDG